MKITLLCSDEKHPVNSYLQVWLTNNGEKHDVELVRKIAEATSGDILFLISCSELITAQSRAKYRATLVLHGSDLPVGRGWSPHIWQLSQGADSITLSLLEAEDRVDSGRIWKKIHLKVPKHALLGEINQILFEAEIQLINYAIENFYSVIPQDQSSDVLPTYYPRRNPEHSQIDPTKSIAEQFDLIRVCDSDRFPAFFTHMGYRYILKLERADEK